MFNFANASARLLQMVPPGMINPNMNNNMQNKNRPPPEYCPDGLRNAWHLIAEKPLKQLVKFASSLKIPVDDGDKDGNTPFMLFMFKGATYIPFMKYEDMFDLFKNYKVEMDRPNKFGVTPFLRMISQGYFERAWQLAKEGADVNVSDKFGNFALKYTVESEDMENTKMLLDTFKADPNKKDKKGRTCLHLAINNSCPTIDSTSELENLLLDYGADVNAIDNRGRCPLHYAFVKIGAWDDNSVIDPIEAVTTLCSKININVNIQDRWGKTPLHYAAQRNSTICSIFLLNRGAQLEAKDKYGNTPLSDAFLFNHPDYAITLVERNADVSTLVNPERPELLKDIEDKEKEEEQGEEEETNDEGPARKVPKKKEYNPNRYDPNRFNKAKPMYNNNNRFGNPMPNMNYGGGYNPNLNRMNKGMPQNNTGKTVTDIAKSMFRVAIIMGWQGLLYLLLDKHYDYMRGMEDALSEGKYQLLLNLLKKTAQDEVVQRFNDKKQNLMHILALHGGNADRVKLQEIYTQFVKRGVKHMAVDIYGRTALHYAIISKNKPIINILLNSQYDPNIVDLEGHTPLSLLVKGNGIEFSIDIIKELLMAGANLNIQYLEDYYDKHLESAEEDSQPKGRKLSNQSEDDDNEFYEDSNNSQHKHEKMKDAKKKKSSELEKPLNLYYTTPFIHLVRYSLLRPWSMQLKLMFEIFLDKGADPAMTDSEQRDAFIYCTLENSNEFVDLLFKRTSKINKKTVDKYGKTAMHYAVQQYEFGSYQNTELLSLLLSHGFDHSIKDEKGLTPVDYAAVQNNGRMLSIFKQYKVALPKSPKTLELHPILQQKSIKDWPMEVDFNKDAEEYIKNVEELIEKEREKPKAKVDSIGNDNEPLEVIYDDKGRPFDCYMNKVNIKNGTYGEYLFYRMQLIRNTNRDVYMVYTRWGRIGETGAFQKTPFSTKEEAITEFSKIFKAKSGNEWENIDKFEKIKKKYVVMAMKTSNLHYKQLIKPFEYKKIPLKSTLPKPIKKLLKEVVDVTSYEKAMGQYGIDNEVLPITRLRKETLLEARKILDKLSEIEKKLAEERVKGPDARVEVCEELYDQANEISSQYYELLPQASYKDFKPPPLINRQQLNAQYGIIEDLINIESASKILLGAQSKLKIMNPLDYCYKSLGIELDEVKELTEENQIIHQYIKRSINDANGWGSNNARIQRIFRVQRRGELERFDEFKKFSNRWLLFHGSKTSNFLGILSQGLRIAPPNVAITGWAFGKGIYFADIFSKSAGYCYSYGGNGSLLMLICEVALGKMSTATMANFEAEGPPTGYDSVRVKGNRGPNMEKRLYLEDGSEIPLGEIVNNNERSQNMMALNANEYVIFNQDQVKLRYLIQWTNGNMPNY